MSMLRHHSLEVSMRAVGLSACFMLSIAPAMHSQAAPAPAAKPAGLHWGPAPAVFPKGAKMAVVSGDTSKAAPFTVELSMPNGYQIPPPFHPIGETVQVQNGPPLVGLDATFDAASA